MSTNTSSRKPAAPAAKAPKATPAPAAAKPASAQPCRCGCGEQTIRPEALYRPGHDARHAGAIAKAILAGADAAEALKPLTPRLQEKAKGIVQAAADRKSRRAASGDAMRAARAAAKAAYDKALAEALAPRG